MEKNWDLLTSLLGMEPKHNEYLKQLLVNLDKQVITNPREKQILMSATCVAFKHIAPKLPENFKVLNTDAETKIVKYKSKFDFLIDESDFDEALPEIVNIISVDIASELDKMLEQKILNSIYILVNTGEKGFRDLQSVKKN